MPADLPEPPVVAIASGKGGVGKSTAAVNIALALHGQGMRVGLVDADLYGPDVPHLMGLRRREDSSGVTVLAMRGASRARLQAVERHGIQLASAAFLIGENQGLGMHAPLAQLLVRRLIADTAWEKPDCLVVDLPPGIADIQQFVFALGRPRSQTIVVVTPQAVAHRDAQRLLGALRHHQVPVLGGIENMAGHLCPSCGQVTELFPPAPPDTSIWARVPLLASVPFSARAARDADLGQPVALTRAVPEQAVAYDAVAARVRAAVTA